MDQAVKRVRPRRYFVDTTRGYVHVQDCGAGERTVVFVTITSFGGVLLDDVLPLMAERGYRAIAIDMMGYGLSDKKSEPWSMEDFADNMQEVFALAGVAPDTIVCGHFSGLIGLELAARGLPGLKGLVIDGTPLIAEDIQANYKPGDGPAPLDWDEDGTHAMAFWKRAYGLIKRLNPDVPLEAQPSNRVRQAYLSYLAVGSFEPGTFEAYATFDVRKRIKDIQIPVQCMCSDTDWNLPHHPYYVENIPHSREVRFKGVHPMHELNKPERAVEYVEVIDGFVKTL